MIPVERPTPVYRWFMGKNVEDSYKYTSVSDVSKRAGNILILTMILRVPQTAELRRISQISGLLWEEIIVSSSISYQRIIRLVIISYISVTHLCTKFLPQPLSTNQGTICYNCTRSHLLHRERLWKSLIKIVCWSFADMLNAMIVHNASSFEALL